MAPVIGKAAPSFAGTAVMPDGSFKELALGDFAGKWVVLYFYPLDFTFVCPTEICAFSDRAGEFEKLNTQLVGVRATGAPPHPPPPPASRPRERARTPLVRRPPAPLFPGRAHVPAPPPPPPPAAPPPVPRPVEETLRLGVLAGTAARAGGTDGRARPPAAPCR